MADAPYLPIAVKNCSIVLEDILRAFKRNPEYKLLYFNRISELFRQVGIGEFLMSYDLENFGRRLQQSAQAYVTFLVNADPSEKATSHATSYFDAICVNDTGAAKLIAEHTPDTLNPSKEYEEDFLYMRIFMDVMSLGKTLDDLTPLLKEYEKYASDSDDQRLLLLESILKKDAAGFDEAVSYLIEPMMEKHQGANLYSGNLDALAIEPHLSIELISWIKCAKQQGLHVSSDYRLVPELLIPIRPIQALGPNQWLNFDSYRSFEFDRKD